MRSNFNFAPAIPGSAGSFRRGFAVLLAACMWMAMLGCGGGKGGDGGNGGNGGGATPNFSASLVTQGNFTSGQQGATYKITVTNTGNAPTNGTVTLVDPPTGFTVTAMAGPNWSCTVATTTCTRGDVLPPSQSYPAITVTGNVTAANGASITVALNVSGGGVASPVTSNPTVTVAAVALAITKTHSGNFTAGQQGATYTVTVKNGASAGATNGKVTVTETVPSGETLASMVGTGWTCPGAGGANTCDRTDLLATGQSYPAITVAVNVAANATSPQVNQATVSGGGITSPVSTTDSTTINPPPVGPDLSMVESHAGNFGAGTSGVLNLAVGNVGTGTTTAAITVTDTLPAQFTYVSGMATGWTCGAAGQLVTCTDSIAVAAGGSAATIPLVVSVAGSASGTVSNTATVATAGDSDAGNNSSTDSVNVLSSLPESISMGIPGAAASGVIYAGGSQETINITVTNQGAGDTLSAALTQNGSSCTAAACGSVGSVAGSASPYTVTYTPPPSVAAATAVALTVTSTTAGAFPATANFTVFPAGAMVVKVAGPTPGSGPQNNLAAYVFNDSSSLGATVRLLAAGYACRPVPSPGTGTTCGTLTVGTRTSATTGAGQGTPGIPFTKTQLSYTPPANMPDPPYDRPMIWASANADSTKVAETTFVLGQGIVTGFLIGNPSRLQTVLTGGSTLTLAAGFGNDTGVNKTVIWSLTTTSGTNCQPACGTLGSPSYAWNGNSVSASIPYTPPATVPSGAAHQPVLTMTPVDAINNNQISDSVQFEINDGTCGSGNNGVLNGQYAFLLRGGGQNAGYLATIGSFTADGNGHVTGGSLDSNAHFGAQIGLSILAAGSSYSIGADGRGCLTLANSNGGAPTFRIAVGALDGSNHATQGRILRFTDNNGVGPRAQGVLMKQDAAAFATAISGNYVFAEEGVTATGARLASEGLYHADGAGILTNFDSDSADGDGNVDTNDTAGSGTYSSTVDANGRGTAIVKGGNAVFYIVSSSEFLAMTTDPIGPAAPILSGDNRKQTAPAGGFAQTSLDGNAYVFYETAVDSATGGNAVLAGLAKFTTNGAETVTQEINVNGNVSEQTGTDSLTIAANGRATNSDGSVALYLVGTDSAFVLNTDQSVPFGYAEQQAAGPFSNASISGQVFFGGGAPTPGGTYDSASATFDGAGTLTLTLDEQDPYGGLGSQSLSISYAIDAATGKLTVTYQSMPVVIGFVVSGSKVVFLSQGTGSAGPELFAGQK